LKCWRAKREDVKVPDEKNSSLTVVCASQISTLESKVAHKKFNQGTWREAQFRDHPTLSLTLKLENGNKRTVIKAVADTGAQSNLWGYRDFLQAGFVKSDLHPVSSKFYVADKRKINIIGAFKGVFTGIQPDKRSCSCRAMVYVSNAVSGFFLSFDTMLDLRIVDSRFPEVGRSAAYVEGAYPATKLVNFPVESVANVNAHEEASCQCPQRSAVPARPEKLPFTPLPENIPKMKKWLLDRYASSTFNTCPHRPLHQMAGPPISIHLDENAVPRVCNTAAPIPLHWQKKVRDDLIRDEALGVIQKVPYGVPVTWCHRMVVTRKADGSPRRTVDLSPLNRFCRRESHYSESPFILARRVPGSTWKTVSDAWNGYHSVPLRESDRHLTTFITPFGRYQYTRAPQGYLSSGDGYNRRFESILSDFQRKERCVDDTVFYDDDLESHWWRTIDFLSLVGSAGIVLNSNKFQFSQRSVDFAGFRISNDKIEPLPKYLDAIRSFPTPKGITDVRSWFGLTNQVANYAQLRDVVAPFRKFLSPNNKFYWDKELDDTFNKSKELIVAAIREGVTIFDTAKPTCLRPDWSRRGIGYFLLQKHCCCNSDLPNCCQSGWKVTLAGSRFLNGAEERYAAIEGEALAIVWGLEQTRYFTQGCSNLIVVTDHKPLVKIFSDRTLDEISNTRLFRFKQRALPWHFKIKYLPGSTNHAADAASRHPDPGFDVNIFCAKDYEESLIIAALSKEIDGSIAISWSRLVEETDRDPVMRNLKRAVREGFSTDYENLSAFTRYKSAMYIADELVLYKDRVVIPPSMRQQVLKTLHAAHQGVSAMELRAQAIVFWPGMSYDIQRVRQECHHCNRNAPSQAAMPTEPASVPLTPFEKIFADYFEFGGRHYLVVGDRLSGWSEVYLTPSGSEHAGSKGLIKCLRSFFSTFGVPQEISSDGGPEFVADVTKKFFAQWDIHHRVSAAYHPQSNGRAELAVKSCKRLLRDNVGPSGSINNDRFLRAMLQLRNTPDQDCNISPAEIVFGRPIKDAFSFCNRTKVFFSPSISPNWKETWAIKEQALRKRFVRWSERHNERAKYLRPLKVGDRCFVQNQHGPYQKKWDRSGLVVDVLPHNKYAIKIDGSNRLTNRNRQFLRLFTPAKMTIDTYDPVHFNTGDDARSVFDDDVRDEVLGANERGDNNVTVHGQDGSGSHSEAHPSDTVTEEIVSDSASTTKKVPYMLKRLETYNRPGLKDQSSPPSTRLRSGR
jgi:hypothetical protein